MGFRKGRGTIDSIYVLTNAINEIIRREKGKAYVLFADMKGAFDKLLEKAIWKRIVMPRFLKGLLKKSFIIKHLND